MEKNMELEEAIQTLKDFAKYGRYYSNNTEHHMKTAINTVLNHITKQEKTIDLIIAELANYDNDYICHSIECKDIGCKECLKQNFKKKAEESE